MAIVIFIITYVQWRIQDFPQGGAQTPKIAIIFQIFAENCMKMKEFGPPGGGGGRVSLVPPLDPPMPYKWNFLLYRHGRIHFRFISCHVMFSE